MADCQVCHRTGWWPDGAPCFDCIGGIASCCDGSVPLRRDEPFTGDLWGLWSSWEGTSYDVITGSPVEDDEYNNFEIGTESKNRLCD